MGTDRGADNRFSTKSFAHDVCNLLTVILGNSEALAARVDEPELRAAIGAIMQAAMQGGDLARRLLEPSPPQSLRLDEVIAAMSGVLRRALGQRIELELLLSDGHHVVVAERARVEAALMNLAVNSLDAMPDGGHLTISTRVLAGPGRRAGGRAGGRMVKLSVRDDGPGMPADIRDRAAVPFFTTKRQGHGLGLASVFRFVEASGGWSTIDSRPGGGTAVHLHFPVVAKEQGGEDRAASTAGGTVGRALAAAPVERLTREKSGDETESGQGSGRGRAGRPPNQRARPAAAGPRCEGPGHGHSGHRG